MCTITKICHSAVVRHISSSEVLLVPLLLTFLTATGIFQKNLNSKERVKNILTWSMLQSVSVIKNRLKKKNYFQMFYFEKGNPRLSRQSHHYFNNTQLCVF